MVFRAEARLFERPTLEVLASHVAVSLSNARMLKRLEDLATTDGLTGVLNKRALIEQAERKFKSAQRYGRPMAVMVCDIDHFKRVNDTFGHPVGDGVLRHVASVIGQRMRAEDVFARYGGEEFVALLRNGDLAATRHMAERMRAAVAKTPAQVDEQTIPVTLSAGCASAACVDDPTPEALIRVADRRLYAAKHAGRNRVVSDG